MDDKELIKAVLHYQQCLDKYTRRNDEARVLYCLSKLYKMPVNIGHLQETGVGRTVNALRKHNGEVAEAAKTLVNKWKEMVAADGEENDSKDTSKPESIKNNNSKDKHKSHRESSSSSHRDSDKKKSRSDSSSEEDTKYSPKKVKDETKRRHHDTNDNKKNRDKHEKHKSSKRKHDSSDESDEEESDSETHEYKRNAHSKSSSEEEEVKVEKKHKQSKRDRNEENYEYSKSKRKKYSESEKSEDEPELIEKKHSHKSSRHHHEKKEKSKHEHKKDKKERSSDSKPRKHEEKSKDKHSSSSSSKSSSKSDKKDKDKETKNDKKSKRSSSKSSDQSKQLKKSSGEKTGRTMGENGIGSGSGASFAEALGMLIPGSSKTTKKKVAVIHPLTVDKPSPESRESSPEFTPAKMQVPELLTTKKLGVLDIKVDNLLPEITPNYKPLGFPIDNGMLKNKLSSEDETLSAIMYNKISRTKVYSGNKVTWGKVPSLFEICTRVLQDNIDALEYTGGVPYLILKPVIERANPDQLFMLEHHNPYLIEETDELWQLHCNKEFRTKRREEMETWRDMYMRCLDEREAKLRALTANIKQSQDKSLPVRQTKLAYVDSFVKPPRNVARKQAKHGTGGVEKKPVVTPSSRLNALATSGPAGQISVPNPGARAVSSSGTSTAVVKPKKAPLMQKTLALMKSRIFRR